MDEEVLLFGVAIVLLLLVVGAPIAAAIALVRSRRLERELRALRSELGSLRLELNLRPEPAAPPPPAAPAPTRAAEEPAPRAAQPAVVSARQESAPRPTPPGPAKPAPPRPPTPARHLSAGSARALDLASSVRAVDWERWIGVRGAAVVGGVLLALAAIFFFRHAFVAGWISPPMRVACGVAAGIACIGGGLRLRRRGYGWAPDALVGAGIVALYASVWAADKRYHLISIAASFPLMAVVTALACWLALRNSSLLTALLGLVGGFATPLLLSTGQDRPLSLFGYVLLLDLGLLLIGRQRRWPSIGILALLGTVLLEALWVFQRMGERLALGLAIVGVFAVLFALSAGTVSGTERRRWFPAQAGAVLFPFAFAFYFAGTLELRGHVWPTALLLGLLALAAGLIARQQGAPWISHGGTSAGVAVVALWFFQVEQPGEATFRELALVALGLAAVVHALAEWERWRASLTEASTKTWRVSAAVGTCTWMVLVVGATAVHRLEGFLPLLGGLAGLAALGLRQATLLSFGALVLPPALALALGLGFAHGGYAAGIGDATLPDPWLFWALPAALGLLFLLVLPRIARSLARFSLHGVGALLVPFVFVALFVEDWPSYFEPLPWLVPAAAPVYGALVLLAAARLGSSPWVAAGTLISFSLCRQGLMAVQGSASPRSEETLLAVLAAMVAGPAVVIALAALILEPARVRSWSWAFLAALGPLCISSVQQLWSLRFGSASEAGPWLLLALPPALAALRLHSSGAASGAPGWIAASACFLLAGGFADQLDHEEFAVGAALWALGLAALARVLALPAAAWSAAALSAVTTLTLLFRALDPYHYTRSERLLLNWISYAHLVPAGALALVTWCLRPGSAAVRRLERLVRGQPGLCVIAILFLWINLLITNHFAHEDRLVLGGEHEPRRDLVTSLAWGAYALALLLLGTWRSLLALRWTSLALLFLAIGKVFLYDLGHLEGLYRVGSLAGLALSLIAVSLFYQRFVFRRAEGAQT